MGFSYKPLFKTLVDKDITLTKLRTSINASPTTFSKFRKNELVSLELLDKICTYLNCNIEDVIKHTN